MKNEGLRVFCLFQQPVVEEKVLSSDSKCLDPALPIYLPSIVGCEEKKIPGSEIISSDPKVLFPYMSSPYCNLVVLHRKVIF